LRVIIRAGSLSVCAPAFQINLSRYVASIYAVVAVPNNEHRAYGANGFSKCIGIKSVIRTGSVYYYEIDRAIRIFQNYIDVSMRVTEVFFIGVTSHGIDARCPFYRGNSDLAAKFEDCSPGQLDWL
jgi:hypothetical protein